MHHFNKNPDAHCRLARRGQRFVRFSRVYQKSAEFKARQAWLDFQDSVGTALQAIAKVVDKSRADFKKWLKNFQIEKIEQVEKKQKSFAFMYWFFSCSKCKQ